MQNPVGNLSIDPTGWLGELQRDLDALLGDLIQVCHAAKSGAYSENLAEHRFGAMRVVVENSDSLAEKSPERAARSCFVGSMRKFVDFLDRLIAVQRVMRDGIVLHEAVAVEDLKAYVEKYIEGQVAKVSKDQSLKVPDKIESFPSLTESVKSIALVYNKLRNTFQHHQDVPKENLQVEMRRSAMFIEDREVVQRGTVIKTGERLTAGIVTETKEFTAGAKAILSEHDAYCLIFTIRNVLAPEFFRAHVETPKASDAAAT